MPAFVLVYYTFLPVRILDLKGKTASDMCGHNVPPHAELDTGREENMTGPVDHEKLTVAT